MLATIGQSKPAQIAIAVSAVMIVGTAMAGIIISEVQGQVLPTAIQTLLYFILGSGATLVGNQQGASNMMRAQQNVAQVVSGTVQATQQTPGPTNGNGAH